MGSLLQALLHESKPAPAAIPAIPAIRPLPSPAKIAESQESQGVTPEKTAPDAIRTRLLALAAADFLPVDLVHGLADADLLAIPADYTDRHLLAYLRALEAAATMDAGMAPTGWDAARYCRLCGPVLLWPNCPPIVQACPWCFRRKAGRYVPRPQVTCGDCRHYLPDPLNPTAGGGDCAQGHGGHWPKQRHRCEGFTPVEAST